MNDILPQLGLNPRTVSEIQPRPQARANIEAEIGDRSGGRSGRQKLPGAQLLDQQVSDALDALGQGQFLERGSIVDIVL